MTRWRWVNMAFTGYLWVLVVPDMALSIRDLFDGDGAVPRFVVSGLFCLAAAFLLAVASDRFRPAPVAVQVAAAVVVGCGVVWTLWAVASNTGRVALGPYWRYIFFAALIVVGVVGRLREGAALSADDSASAPPSPTRVHAPAPDLDHFSPDRYRILGHMTRDERRRYTALNWRIYLSWAVPSGFLFVYGLELMTRGSAWVGGSMIAVGIAIAIAGSIWFERAARHQLAATHWVREHWPRLAARYGN